MNNAENSSSKSEQKNETPLFKSGAEQRFLDFVHKTVIDLIATKATPSNSTLAELLRKVLRENINQTCIEEVMVATVTILGLKPGKELTEVMKNYIDFLLNESLIPFPEDLCIHKKSIVMFEIYKHIEVASPEQRTLMFESKAHFSFNKKS